MRWNKLFADLEAQLHFGNWEAVEQDAAELTRGMWAELTLMDRLRAALGQSVRLHLLDGRSQQVTLQAVGPTWVGGLDATSSMIIPRHAIVSVDGALSRAVLPRRRLRAGPSLAAICRMLARRRESIQVIGASGLTLAEGTIDRVGKDHIDVALHARDEFRRAGAVQGLRIVSVNAVQLIRASPMGIREF